MRDYEWVKMHEELTEKLLNYRYSRAELVKIVEESFELSGLQLPKLGPNNEFDDIDPFSFFGLVHKGIKVESKINLLNAFKKNMNLVSEVPQSFEGIPTMNNQNATFYRFDDNKSEQIDELWEIFSVAYDYTKSDSRNNEEIFKDYFNIFHRMPGNKRSKITIGLFWMAPQFFISLDNSMIDYLYFISEDDQDLLELLDNVRDSITGEQYMSIMNLIKDKIINDDNLFDSLLDLSVDAWEYVNESKKSDSNNSNLEDLIISIKKGDRSVQVDFEEDSNISVNNSTLKKVTLNNIEIKINEKGIIEEGIKQLIEYFNITPDDQFIDDEYMFNDTVKLLQGRRLMRLGFFQSKESLEEYAESITNNAINSKNAYNKSNCVEVNGYDYCYRFNAIVDYISLLVGMINKYGDEDDVCLVEISKLKDKDEFAYKQSWAYSPGTQAKYWKEFQEESVFALGWDYLGDLNAYSSREEIESSIAAYNEDNIRPYNDSKALWDFKYTMGVGDIVYVKRGNRTLLGKGVIMSDYFFDESLEYYKHRRRIKWLKTGEWELREPIANKVLTDFTKYKDWLAYADGLMDDIEELEIDNAELESNNEEFEFIAWLSIQKTSNDDVLDSKTVAVIRNALIDISSYFYVDVFTLSTIEMVKELKDKVMDTVEYVRYSSVKGIAFNYYIKYLETKPKVKNNELYDMNQFLNEVYVTKEKANTIKSVLENKKNIILKGAPGVGKTFIADRLAYLLMEEKDESRIHMVQFHQSYSYEDFIEGYRPKVDQDGFELKQGPFINFCRKAERDSKRKYFFIIDEINRGNLSKIFGELLMLIETDKRGKSINLLYSNEKFSVPSNIYIIGMMNTADRSLALLDYALRRRFSFIELHPALDNDGFLNYVNLKEDNALLLKVINEVKILNREIVESLGTGFQIGHSYFIDDNLDRDINQRVSQIVEFEIIPLIEEYWFDDEELVKEYCARFYGILNAI